MTLLNVTSAEVMAAARERARHGHCKASLPQGYSVVPGQLVQGRRVCGGVFWADDGHHEPHSMWYGHAEVGKVDCETVAHIYPEDIDIQMALANAAADIVLLADAWGSHLVPSNMRRRAEEILRGMCSRGDAMAREPLEKGTKHDV